MKQTNNALTFLMAQYRAIFKNAYFKGIASAVVVTAGLAAGQAQATDYTATNLSGSTNPLNVGVGDTLEINIPALSNTTPNWTVDVILKNGAAGGVDTGENFIVSDTASNITVSGSGSLTIGRADNGSGTGLFVSPWKNNVNAKVQIKSIKVEDGGSITADNYFPANTSSGSTVLQADSIEIQDGGRITLQASDANNNTTLSGSITLREGGVIELKDSASSGDKAVIQGALDGTGTLRFMSKGGTISGDGTVDTANLNVVVESGANGILNLTAGKSFNAESIDLSAGLLGNEALLTIKQGTLDLTGTNIKAGDYGSIIFGAATANAANAVLAGNVTGEDVGNWEVGSTSGGTITAYGTGVTGNITVNSGNSTVAIVTLTDDPKTADTDESLLEFTDGTVTLVNGNGVSGGQIKITDGTLAVVGNATLKASGAASAANEAGNIFVSGTAAVGSTPAIIPTFRTTSDNVTSLLSMSGSIVLSDGTLELTDDADLADFKFSGAAATPTTGTATTIVVDANNGVTASSIKGNNITVSSTLKDSAGVALASALNLNISAADTLTLGSADTHNTGDLGFAESDGRNVVFKDSGTFELHNSVALKAIDKDADDKDVVGSGSITGDVILATGGELDVQAGNYAYTNKMTLSSGDVIVGIDDPKNTLTAVLDLTGATVTPTAGTFNVNRLGTLNINSTTANAIAAANSATKTTINGGATVNVAGDVAADGSKLTTTGTAGFAFANATAEEQAKLLIDGDLSLTGATNMSIGANGVLQANNWTVTNTATSGNTSFGAGNYVVQGNLTNKVSTDTTTSLSDNAHFTFNASEGLHSVGTNLVLSGSTSAGAQVDFAAGSWDVQNITLNNANDKLTIGSNEVDAAATSVNAKNYALTVNAGTVNVANSATSRFTELHLNNSNAHMTVNGQMTVDGKFKAEVLADKTATPSVAHANGSRGITLATGSTIRIDGAAAKLTLGNEVLKSFKYSTDEAGTKKLALYNAGTEAAPNNQLVYEFIDSTNVKTDAAKAQGGTKLFNKNITVDNYGTLTLRFDDGVVLDSETLRLLRKDIFAVGEYGTNSLGDALKHGYIDLGGASFTGITTDANGNISNNVLSSYRDIISDTLFDDIKDALLIDIDDNIIQGNVGAARLDGNDTIAYVDGATLNKAAANENGYFISNEAGAGDTMQVFVNAGKVLGLNGGGNIGQVTLVSGTATDPTVLNVSGDAVTTFASLEGRANSKVNLLGETVIKGKLNGVTAFDALNVGAKTTVQNGSVTANGLNVDQELNVANGDITISDLTSSKDATTTLPVTTGSINTKNLTVNGNVLYGGSITASGNVNIDGNLNEEASPDYLARAGKLTAQNLNVTGETHYFGDMAVSNKATFGGDTSLLGNNTFKDIEAAGNLGFYAVPNADGTVPSLKTSVETITFRGEGRSLELENGVVLSAGVIQGLTADNKSTSIEVAVGTDAGSDSEDTWTASTGYLMADRIDLAGGKLIADPRYDQAASVITVGSLGKATDVNEDAGILTGNALALRNGILAIGVDRKDAEGNEIGVTNVQNTFKHFLNDKGALNYTANNANDVDSVGAILYVAKPVTVAAGSKLIANSTLTRSDVDGNVQSPAGSAALDSTAADIQLDKNGALAVNAYASQQTDDKGNSTKAAINFQRTGATISSNGGKIILVGGFNPNKHIVLFKDADVDDPETEVNESNIELTAGSTITVISANGVLIKTLTATDNKYIANDLFDGFNGEDINEGVVSEIWADASNPVRDTLAAYLNYTGSDVDGNPVLNYVSTATESGRDAEVVARLGAYGGAAQTALAAGSTTYEAVSGRMGVGANGTNITVADNTQGAALWLTPVYKNRDSDGFGADGVEYGTDLDLYGVALGADYTLANGVKIGAAFNIGSGDADGNGAGEGVSNDFDYYGFAIYGGYTYGPYSVVADISYTTVDNDVDATTSITGVGKVGTSFDSSSLSVGVTGQYQAILDGDVSVTPHAGLRYTKIDLDDYTVHGEKGDVAAYSSDDLSIFSIPFGVTVAKEFVNGTWTVKPSFDLTLTANFGDDSADGSVDWGVDGLKHTAVSSEVLDNFTYGATVGVAAKSGNFSLGFGLNYTGSSNTDEFGVNANARFVF